MNKSDYKEIICDIFAQSSDQDFSQANFFRSAKGLEYKLTDGPRRVLMSFDFTANPSYNPGSCIHFLPRIVLQNSEISNLALQLSGDEQLLANAPETIQNVQLATVRMVDSHSIYVPTIDKVGVTVDLIRASFFLHGLEWANMNSTKEGIIGSYEHNEKEGVRQKHWYIHLISCYILKGDTAKALGVFDRHLGKPGLIEKYKHVRDKILSFVKIGQS